MVDIVNLDQENVDGIDSIVIPDNIATLPASIVSEEAKLSPEQIAELGQDIALENKYGDSPIKAAAAGLGRGLSFGISDQALIKAKIVDAQTLRELEQRNKEASLVGEVGGILATGLPGTVVKGVGLGVRGAAALGKLTEKEVANLIRYSGNSSIASRILKKGIAKSAGSAVETSFYGAGQLISEDALGTADFNAENLLSAVGSSAIIGGLAGGAFGAIEGVLPVLKAGKDFVVEKGRRYLDPQDAALRLSGVSPSKMSKLKKNSPDIVEALPELLRTKGELGLLTSDTKLKEFYGKLKTDSASEISSVFKELEVLKDVVPALNIAKKDLYTKIISALDAKFINKYKDVKSAINNIGPVKRLRAEYDKDATLLTADKIGSKEYYLSPGELNDLRIKQDKFTKFEGMPGTNDLLVGANKEIRDIMRKETDRIIELADQSPEMVDKKFLLQRLKQANKEYRIAVAMLPNIEGKVDKKALFGFSEVVGTGAILGDAASGERGGMSGIGALLLSRKFLESDVLRRLKILNAIERTNKSVATKINSSIRDFFSGVGERVLPASSVAIKESVYGRKDMKGRKPESDLEAFNNASENLSNLSSNPETLLPGLNKNTLKLSTQAPQTSAKIQERVVASITFLNSKLPRDPRPHGTMDVFRQPWQPSSVQLAKFARYVDAVESPMSALNDLKNGYVSNEAVEVLQNVYPDLYKRSVNVILEQLDKNKDSLTYKKRLQLNKFLGTPTDSSLTPASLKSLQMRYVAQEQPQQQAPVGTNLDTDAESLKTPVERVQTRK